MDERTPAIQSQQPTGPNLTQQIPPVKLNSKLPVLFITGIGILIFIVGISAFWIGRRSIKQPIFSPTSTPPAQYYPTPVLPTSSTTKQTCQSDINCPVIAWTNVICPDNNDKCNEIHAKCINGYCKEQKEIDQSKLCVSDDDCGLLKCSGCFNNNWIKNSAFPDLACEKYAGYSCKCVNNSCNEVKRANAVCGDSICDPSEDKYGCESSSNNQSCQGYVYCPEDCLDRNMEPL